VSDFGLHQLITAIAEGFQLFECIQCATAIQQFLISQNQHGKIVSIETGGSKKPFGNIDRDRLLTISPQMHLPHPTI